MSSWLDTLFNASSTPKTYNIRPMVLLVLDGWGIAPPSAGNAMSQARLPRWDQLISEYPNTKLIASGESVGLPANEVGNSEVGHLTMGVGRTVLESLPRINKAIETGDFYSNRALLKAISYARENNTNLHVCGLIGSGNVHSSTEHLFALLELCKRQSFTRVYLHLFTDGRDAPPQDGAGVMETIEKRLVELQLGQIVSVAGRYYAMDRDARWERTEKVYRVMTLGEGATATSASEAIKSSYEQNLTDEFVIPTLINQPGKPPVFIKDGDAMIYFNFRVDRARQLSQVFVLPDFEQGILVESSKNSTEQKRVSTFERPVILKNLCFVTMTEYQHNLPVSAVAYPKIDVEHTLSEVLAQQNLRQFHLAESEKEKMVTYYFDGMRLEPFSGEDIMIVPSSKVGTYDRKPEMSLSEIMREFHLALEKDVYHFIVMNFANPDMVAHSGNLSASIKACEIVDRAVGEIVDVLIERQGTLCITADHGNVEELLTYDQSSFFFTSSPGTVNTEHSNNPVPFVIMNPAFKNNPAIQLRPGALSDVAPTMLGMMNLPVPKEMTGNNLLEQK